ncbi:hypothetical protein N9W41_01600, partial [bacterium]|nr:hypothetical protein [bacterium]
MFHFKTLIFMSFVAVFLAFQNCAKDIPAEFTRELSLSEGVNIFTKSGAFVHSVSGDNVNLFINIEGAEYYSFKWEKLEGDTGNASSLINRSDSEDLNLTNHKLELTNLSADDFGTYKVSIFYNNNLKHEDVFTLVETTTCDLPWGGKIIDGQSIIAYQAAKAPYYSTCTSQVRQCDGTTLSGSFSFESCEVSNIETLANNQHDEVQCTSIGGTVVGTSPNKFCKFSRSTCPSGWTQYQNWSKTSAYSQTYANFITHYRGTCKAPTGSVTCSTGSHGWSNTAQESKSCA